MKRSILFLIFIILLSLCGFAQVGEQQPITNLEAAVHENDTVLLAWNLPERYDTDIMISWSSMMWMNNSWGVPNGQCASDQAAQFDAIDLKSLIGWQIKDVSVILSYADTLSSVDKHYSIRIWKGEDNYSSFIYEKEIDQPEYSIPLTVSVDSMIIIEEGEGVRVGWYLDQYTAYPWEMDNLPVAPNGKGFYYRMYHKEQTTDLCEADPTWGNDWPMPTGNLNVSATLVHPDKNTQEGKRSNQITGYRVYRDGELVGEIPYSFVTYFKDTEYTRGFDVEYCVTAIYGDDESEPVCVTAVITGVAETDSHDRFTVSPNPTNGIVRIEGGTIAEMKVYNTLGQLVKTAQNTNEISLKGLPQGIYTLHVTDENGDAQAQKVVNMK